MKTTLNFSNSVQQVDHIHAAKANPIVPILLKKPQRNNSDTKASNSFLRLEILELKIFLSSKQHLTKKRLKVQKDLKVERNRYCKAVLTRTLDLNINNSSHMVIVAAVYNHYTSKIICKRFPQRAARRKMVSTKPLFPINTIVITIPSRTHSTYSTPVHTWSAWKETPISRLKQMMKTLIRWT